MTQNTNQTKSKKTMDDKPVKNEPAILTDQRGYTLNASLVPVLLIVGIIIGAGYFLLRGEIELPKLGTDRTEVRRLDDFPTVQFTKEELDDNVRVVITSQEELNDFLNMIDSTGQLVLTENINFEKEFLLGAATESRDTTGYTTKIKKIHEDKEDKSLVVTIEEVKPGEFCEVDTQNNIAVDIVAISKTDWDIEFEKETKTDECENEMEQLEETEQQTQTEDR